MPLHRPICENGSRRAFEWRSQAAFNAALPPQRNALLWLGPFKLLV